MRLSKRRIKVLLAKPGLDGHDVGAKVVVHALMMAGFDVVYTGLRQTPDAIAAAAEAEVDVAGLSILSGTHLSLCRRLRDLLSEKGLYDKLWIVGGNISEEDRMVFKQLGYRGAYFRPEAAQTRSQISFGRM
jgi:methylmalonyl-CoA mutase C-terminal domain/subunit